jgi:D-serine deaminase-like pyridoxal phosphate-dependent protein
MDAARLLAAAEVYETPLAVVDVAAMERNLARMAGRAGAAGVRLRPHAKTHKSALVAQRQLAHGSAGLTVATLKEAEVFAGAGVRDLLVAHPPVGEAKLRRLAALAGRIDRLAVSLDDVGVAVSLPGGVEVLWEVDTGLGRLGTEPGRSTVDAVQRLVEALGADRFRGLLTHAGHAYAATDRAGRSQVAEQEWRGLVESAEALRALGIDVRELSVGSTPTAEFVPVGRGVTEMRPGTYVYGDANQVALGSMAVDDCALAVVATVVSTPAPGRVVIDAGSKALSADLRVPGLEGHGLVPGRGLLLARLNEEHAIVTGPETAGLHLGDRLLVIPAHVCTTVNLHPAVLMVPEAGEPSWDPVAARGWR